MTSAQVVETSVTNNSSFQNYPHPDDHTIRTTEKAVIKLANASYLGEKNERKTDEFRYSRTITIRPLVA